MNKNTGTRPTVVPCGSSHSCFRPTNQPKNTSGHNGAFEPLKNYQIVELLITVQQNNKAGYTAQQSRTDRHAIQKCGPTYGLTNTCPLLNIYYCKQTIIFLISKYLFPLKRFYTYFSGQPVDCHFFGCLHKYLSPGHQFIKS